MKKQTLAIFFIVVLLALAMSLFAACDGGEQTEEGVFYIPPKAPSGDLPEVTKPETDYNLPQQITKEDCEYKKVTDSQGLTYQIRNGKAIIGYNLYYTVEEIQQLPSDIVIPATVECYGYDFDVVIDDYAFTGSICPVRNVVIEEGVKEIGKYAFRDAYLQSIVIPDSVEEIKEYTFSSGWIDSIVIGEGVRVIGKSAFEDCNINSLTLPESLQEIGERAFYNSDIQSVEIKSATSIGDYAFGNCVNLTDVTFPNNLEKIGTFAFSNTNIQSANIQSAISIGDYAFGNCVNLTDVIFPDNLEKIEKYAFSNTNIQSVEIKSAISIGEYAFSGCANLIKVRLSDNLKEIGSYAFCDSAYLRGMTIPASVERIGYSILDNLHVGWLFCEAEQRPEGWDENWCMSKTYVVWDCTDKSVTIDGRHIVKDGILYYDIDDDSATAEVVYYDNWLPRKEITVPSKITVDGEVYDVKKIGSSAFAYDKDIQKAVIGEGVRTIGAYSFYKTGLSEVVLSDSVDFIEFYAFADTYLTQVVLPENMRYICEGAFNIATLESIEFTGPKTWRYVENAQYVYIDVSDPVKNVETVQNIKRYGCIVLYTGDYYL